MMPISGTEKGSFLVLARIRIIIQAILSPSFSKIRSDLDEVF